MRVFVEHGTGFLASTWIFDLCLMRVATNSCGFSPPMFVESWCFLVK